MVEGVTTHNIYEEQYGIVEEETILYFFNSFAIPLIWLINPWNIYKSLKRRIYYKSKDFTQEEANKLMERSEYVKGKRYG